MTQKVCFLEDSEDPESVDIVRTVIVILLSRSTFYFKYTANHGF